MDCIVEVLMKFEASLQLKTRTTGTQESFATKPTAVPKPPAEADQAEYLASLQALIQDKIVEINATQKSLKLRYNSGQNVINLPAIVGCSNWIALRTRPDVAWATSGAASLITHDPDSYFIVSNTFVNIYITLWDMHCDMFQYLQRPSTSCGS